jgi:dipeptidase E
MKQIIAIGGGGGLGNQHPNQLINQYILNQSNKPSPKICFLPQASAESMNYIVNFYQTFCKLGAQPSHISLYGRVEPSWKQHLLAQDIIYVGGGNTRSMLALWREWGMDLILREAYDQGVILSGVSAGAICWFEQGITDSVWPLGVLEGLGILEGSCCPHYDDEPERRPAYLGFVKSGTAKTGIALAEETAAHYVNGKLQKIVAAQKNKHCFQVSSHQGEEELELLYLG